MSSPFLKFFFLTSSALSLVFTQSLSSQALPTASKNTDISIFGGYTVVAPDYEPAHDKGVTMGVDYTRYIHRLPFVPSLEFRFGDTTGPAVNEHFYLVGFKAQRDYRIFHPYLDFMGGIGAITYAAQGRPGYGPDHGRDLAMGAGVDIDLTRRFQAKIDLQYQSWNLGANLTQKPQGGDYTLSPVTVTVGVTYRIPFHPFVGPRHPIYKNPSPPPAPPPPPAQALPPPPADATTQPVPANTAQPDTNNPPSTPPPGQP